MGLPSTETSLPLRLPPIHTSLPSHFYSILCTHALSYPSRLFHDSCAKNHPHLLFHVSHRHPVNFNFKSTFFHRNGSNFSQPLRQQPIHDPCARESQDPHPYPHPHRIHSSTVSLLRLHAARWEHAIELGQVTQQRPTLEWPQYPCDIIIAPPISHP